MVKKIIAKPHLFFFGLVPIFILIAFLSGDETIDINIHATYFIITNYHLYLFSAVFFAMIGINYFSLDWTEKPPNKWLTSIHILLQLIALFLLLTKHLWNWIGNQSYEGIQMINDNSNIVIFFSILIFFLSVFFHLINFFTSLFLKKL
ncbi:hypothetical protein [uncultured Polaribacter sp.]|uniref:hypothetical protein n=1 Tax=uncultured Polaribacter sp. TaxID=174711 RepID=UPI0026274947|nr:hypothetical protein [uncultured Polaribacter sp.]